MIRILYNAWEAMEDGVKEEKINRIEEWKNKWIKKKKKVREEL